MAEQKPFPAQHQAGQPGHRDEMSPRPRHVDESYKASDKLAGKIALITGGDSGIGRSVAIAFAKEGANLAIVYLDEQQDAEETRRLVEQEGRQCLTFSGDVGDEQFCRQVVKETVNAYGRVDVLVNNAGEQHPCNSIEDIDTAQLEQTFRTNLFSMFHLIKASLPHMEEGSAIINTTSVTAYDGNPMLLDYSASKGAIVGLTRSLSLGLASKGIRVNAVAPGPVWTPLIPATFPADKVATFGTNTPMKRAGQPAEVAPCYVFLASSDSSYISGQVLHPNGGKIVSG